MDWRDRYGDTTDMPIKQCDEVRSTNETNFSYSREFCTLNAESGDRALEKAKQFFSELDGDKNVTTTPDQHSRKMTLQTPKPSTRSTCKELAAVEREKAELAAKLAAALQQHAELAAAEQENAKLTAKLATVEQENAELMVRLAEAAAHIADPPSGGDSFTVYAISIEPTETIELTVRPGDNVHWAICAGFDIRASEVERVLIGDHGEVPKGATFAEMGIEEEASLTVAYHTNEYDLLPLRDVVHQAQHVTQRVRPLAMEEVQTLDYGGYTKVHVKRKALANSKIAEELKRLLASVETRGV